MCLIFLLTSLFFIVCLPEIEHEDTGAWLQQVATIIDQMHIMLGRAVGTLWWDDPDLRSDLGGVVELLQRAPTPVGGLDVLLFL